MLLTKQPWRERDRQTSTNTHTNPSSEIPKTVPSVLITVPERLGTHHRLLTELISFFFFFYYRSDIAAPRDKTDSVHENKPSLSKDTGFPCKNDKYNARVMITCFSYIKDSSYKIS